MNRYFTRVYIRIFIFGLKKLLKTINLNWRLYLTYIDDIFDIPYEWTKGKSKVNVKFQARENKKAGGLFSLKITSDKDLR